MDEEEILLNKTEAPSVSNMKSTDDPTKNTSSIHTYVRQDTGAMASSKSVSNHYI